MKEIHINIITQSKNKVQVKDIHVFIINEKVIFLSIKSIFVFYFIFLFYLYIYPLDSQESDGGANT